MSNSIRIIDGNYNESVEMRIKECNTDKEFIDFISRYNSERRPEVITFRFKKRQAMKPVYV